MPKCYPRPLAPFGTLIESPDAGAELDLTATELRAMIRETPLLLFRGFTIRDREHFLSLASEKPDHSDLLHWEFGPVMELKVTPDIPNYLFSNEKVPFHWDGAFFRVPSYLVFHCLRAPEIGCGGETLFADTSRVWDEASLADRARWRKVALTYETEKKAHYGGKITTQLVDAHPTNGKTILRFAEEVGTKLNPVSLQVTGLEFGAEQKFIIEMAARVMQPQTCYSHAWQEGDFLIADNHQLIHGRNEFRHATPRHIRRAQIL